MADLTFSCRCGALGGTFDSRPGRDTHIRCHCGDCRAFLRTTSGEDPGTAGVGIVQTAPEQVRIDRGAGHLRALVLAPGRSLVRWYAGCCGTPIAATPRSRAIPFAGLLTGTFADPAPLGRVAVRGFLPPRSPGGPQRHEGLPTLIARMVRRIAASRLTGGWRSNPFFADGRPVAEIRPLTEEERAAAYA